MKVGMLVLLTKGNFVRYGGIAAGPSSFTVGGAIYHKGNGCNDSISENVLHGKISSMSNVLWFECIPALNACFFIKIVHWLGQKYQL